MAEPVFGLTRGAAKLVGEIANKHRQRLPDVGRRTRRVPAVSGTTPATGGRLGARAHVRRVNADGSLEWSNFHPNLLSAGRIALIGSKLFNTGGSSAIVNLAEFDPETGIVRNSGLKSGVLLNEIVANATAIYAIVNGGTLYSFTHAFADNWNQSLVGGTHNGLGLDSSGQIYTTRPAAGGYRVWDSAGGTVLNVSYTGGPTGFAIDSSGNVYTANNNSTGITVRKYDSAGVAGWTYTHGGNLNDIALDEANDRVFVCGAAVSSNTIRALNATTGALLWSAIQGTSAYSIVIDSVGNVWVASTRTTYSSGNRSLAYTVGKYNGETGALLAVYDTWNAEALDLQIDADDNLYITAAGGGTPESQNNTVIVI